MIQIDGAAGEGGGQIIRSALSLALATGKPFHISNIRANREKPGLHRQHLTALHAAAQIGCAEVDDVALGAQEFTFRPGKLTPGAYRFDVGSAGSALLVLQTLLPPLLAASSQSQIRLTGGTHNPGAPVFEFLEKTFLPWIRRMGASVTLRLKRRGFSPAGGGKLLVQISPAEKLQALKILDAGKIVRVHARVLISNLPRHIAEREQRVLKQELDLPKSKIVIEDVTDAAGPGNVVLVTVEREAHTEIFTGFGRRGVRAETVAAEVCTEATEYLEFDAPVGKHLADQLLLPIALAGEGEFLTGPLTRHARTNMAVIKNFAGTRFDVEESCNVKKLRVFSS